MEIGRAREIAGHFVPNTDFSVEYYGRGLRVYNHGRSSYFVHESGFWAFVFRLAIPANKEKAVSRIEAHLKA